MYNLIACVNIRKSSEAAKQPFLYWIDNTQAFPCEYH